MGDLHVTVRYHGAVIEDRVLPVRGAVRLGESEGAEVQFPGAEITVCRVGCDLDISGRRLKPGQRTGVSTGAVHVQVEHVERLTIPRLSGGHFDLRFFLVAMAVTAGGMWLDTLASVAENPAGGALAYHYERLQAALPASGVDDRRSQRVTSVQPNSDLYLLPPARDHLVDGPPAHPDDSVTGWAYYPWYRAIVPASLGDRAARQRQAAAADDRALHAAVARDSYQADRWEVSHLHYQWLSKADPGEVEWLYGLGLARKRMGMHRAELETWERLLELDPDHFMALGNRAVSLARQDRWSEVSAALTRMYRAAPDHPYGHVFEATCAALQGREDEAVASLERAVATRGAMSDELQIELRRDLALDPALAPLRADPRLRAMLSRQLGAASPRPHR